MSEVASLLNLTNDPINANEKLEALKVAILHLKKVDTQEENTLLQRSTSFIVSAFSTAITISGLTLMPPIVGGALISACVVSAGGALITLAHDIFTERDISEKARILRAVLASHDLTKWAKLWSLTDTSTFLLALEYACQGHLQVVDGQDVFHHSDRKHPFAVAYAWVTSTQTQDINEPTPMIPQVDVPTLTPTNPQVVELKLTPEKSDHRLDSTLPPEANVLPQTRDELIEALERECPALLGLVKSHPLRVVGVQRSGKTTLVKVLALLRMALIPSHNVIASTPHYEPGNDYPDVFRVVGLTPNLKRDYPAIQREWNALASRIYESVKNNTTTVWDEFGVYGDILTEDELSSVLTSSLRESMKFGEYPIFIVHGETKAFIPGSNGLVGNFLHSTVRVEAIGEKVKGEDGLETIRPTGKFKVRDLDKTQTSGKIPDWLTEEFLLELVGNNPSIPKPQPSLVNVNEPTEETPPVKDNVPVAELKVSDALGEPLKTIWLLAKDKNDWVTSKEIYQKSYAILKGKGVKEIRQYLGLLADTGYGQIDEEGKSDSSVAFKVY
jgi:hypothetical protein